VCGVTDFSMPASFIYFFRCIHTVLRDNLRPVIPMKKVLSVFDFTNFGRAMARYCSSLDLAMDPKGTILSLAP
jgi:hypothetical protein